MRKVLLALIVPLMLAAGTLAAFGDAPDILARFERLYVSAVDVRGTRYIDADEVRRLVPAYQDERGGGRALERRLRTHILVEEATVRSLPGDTLEIVIRERRPVALVATPALEPVDGRGEYLPIDPALHRLDLPLLRPTQGVPGILMRSEHQQIQTMAGELERLGAVNPDFAHSVSELVWESRETVAARFSQVPAELRFEPPLAAHRLRQGLAALTDALSRAPRRTLTDADLRFEDQVVVRHTPLGRSYGRR